MQARNDASTLPLEDVATFLTDSTFQHIPTNLPSISPQIHSLQPTFLHVCAPNL
ncbi:MAG: hypothetical protein K9G11_03095 [Rickettsiaceae bacterium]|nr:hypothetical protein [Rickettsiaceae bacterium]